MKAFDRLDPATQAALTERVEFRRNRFLELTKCGYAAPSILLVGDRPAPDAPDDPRFHYTPFGAKHHSSLWVNLQLHQAGIPEKRLTWINAYDHKGQPNDYALLDRGWQQIILLGKNAHTWFVDSPNLLPHVLIPHPQAWKRFHSKQPYPLIELLT